MSFLDLSQKWEYKYIPELTGGLNYNKPANLLDDSELVTAEGLFLYKNLIQKDTGYYTFGQQVRGEPRLTFQFYKTDGTSELVLITNDTFYIWAATPSEWQYVSDGNSTTTINDEVAGQTVIEVASTTGFSVGDYVGIALSDGSQHQSSITSIAAGTSITIADAIPTGSNTGVGAVVLKAVDLTGSLDIQVSVVVLPSHDWLVFTNGVDNVKRYNGTDCIDLPGLTNVQARLVGLFNNHLVLAHVTDSGTRYPQMVKWSDTGDPTNWTSGNAGYQHLYDSEDWLVALSYLGPYMMLYRERSIVRVSYVGSVDKLFEFESVVSGEGALSQDSVIDLGDFHFFIGNSNVYEYRGGYDIQPIGDKIYYKIFGNGGELNPSYRARVFGFYVEELDEVWVFYPDINNQKPNKLLRYRQEFQSWTLREFSHDVTGFGLYQNNNTKTWNDLVGDWTQQNWTWDSRSLSANSPTTHLCSADNLQVYEYDYLYPTDNGTEISFELETKDFGNPRFISRIDLFDFRIKGSNVLIEYSIDEGLTWNTLTTITSSILERNVVYKQFASQYFRLRFSGTGEFQLQSIGFVYRVESEI